MFHLIHSDTWKCAFVSDNYYKLTALTERRINYFLQHPNKVDHLPEETAGIARAVKRLMETPDDVELELKMTGMDGVTRHLRCEMHSASDQSGMMHIYGHLIDTTDQLRKAEELRIREEEGRAVLLQSGKMVYRYILEGRRAILSDKIAALFDIPAQIDNWPQWAIDRGKIQRDSANTWLGMFAAIDNGEKSGSVEVKFRRGDKNMRRYRVNYTGITDSSGKPVSAILSFEDVTTQYEENRIKGLEMEGLLKASRETFPEVIVVNLRKNEYRIIQYEGYTSLGTAQDGILDDMINLRIPAVAEEDRQMFIDFFSPESLRKAFIKEGKERISAVYRRLNKTGEAFWFETTVMRMANPYDDDVMIVAASRSIDEQKAEEERLSRELYLQAEELRLAMGRVGNVIVYYDIETSTLTVPPLAAERRGMPEVVSNFPESLEIYGNGAYTPEAADAIKQLFKAIRKGEPMGSCELLFVENDGTERWENIEFTTIRDKAGHLRKAVIFVEDITELHAQGMENVRLREQERLLRSVARHSDRVVCYYDIMKGRSEHWSDENCAKCILPKLCRMPLEEMLQDSKLMPDSVKTVKTMFDDIHRGVVEDRCRIHIRDDEGVPKWLDMKYSTRFNDEHKPVAVMFSYADITKQYEREMAYERYSLMLRDDEKALLVIETNLSADRMVRKGGTLAETGLFREEGITHDEFREIVRRTSATEEGFEEANRFFSREYLLMQFTDGNRHLKAEWQMVDGNGQERWLLVSIDMVRDPYTMEIKGFCRAVDITETKEEQIRVQTRAERDAMTGLLNRGTCEERISQIIEEGNDIRGGVLLLLDLDDLKGINDTYGHEQGDRVIRSIADTMKTHFREGDIIGRIGGDEFMIFLRKAAGREQAIGISISSLLRKLSLISFGENGERSIQCSIGCATEIIGRDSFESMYKRADLALYHVKRNGKNSHIFYSQEMEQADYHFRTKNISLKDAKNFEWNELQHLMAAISTFYPMIISVNLTQNTYYMMEVARDNLAKNYLPVGRFDDFVKDSMRIIHPDDREFVQENLSREALIKAHQSGKANVLHTFRYKKPEDGFIWVKYVYIFHQNEEGDLCCFGMTRWAQERQQEMELLRMQKILELAVASAFEYFCLIDTEQGTYSMYGNDGKNTHTIPKTGNFDSITRDIRDHYIMAEERTAYYEKASLDSILEHMRNSNNGDGYIYTYKMPDGEREAAFHWYEPTHTELLMTVRKL